MNCIVNLSRENKEKLDQQEALDQRDVVVRRVQRVGQLQWFLA